MTTLDKQMNHDSSHLAAPYEGIAKIYDKMMQHVEYDRWADFIVKILKQETDFPPKVIELACGTGIIADLLSRQGVEVTGYDASPAMISQARRKYDSPRLKFKVATFDDFPLYEKFHAALCLYDSINYILTVEGIISFIRRVKQVLHPGGVFIFDICTRFNSYTNFRGFTDEGVIDGYYYFRFSNYSPKNHIHTNDFLIHPQYNPAKQIRENHRQYIFSVRQIQSALKKSGMNLVMKFDDINLLPAKINSLRIHFLARKPRKV